MKASDLEPSIFADFFRDIFLVSSQYVSAVLICILENMKQFTNLFNDKNYSIPDYVAFRITFFNSAE